MKDYGYTYLISGKYRGQQINSFGIVFAFDAINAENKVIAKFREEHPHHQELTYKVHPINDLWRNYYIENGWLVKEE
jgi:hypothetical protein